MSVLVRARVPCLEAFLGGMGSETRRPLGQLASRLASTTLRTFLERLATRLPLDDHRQGFLSLPRPAIGGNGGYVVQEYQPVVHRLRLAASA